MLLLSWARAITKWGRYFDTKWGKFYYKLGQILQSGETIAK